MSGLKKNLALLTFVAFLMVLTTLLLREVANRPLAFEDFAAGESSGAALFTVAQGATGEEIARNLEREGIIASWQTFFRLALTDDRSTRIAPGIRQMDKRIPAAVALEQLLDFKRIQGLIILRDGVRLSEVKRLLKENGYTSVEEAINAARVPEPFTFKEMEGFFYPATYSFEPRTTAQFVIASFLDRFEEAMRGVNWESSSTDLTPDEILVLASLIEAEGTSDVFGRISRVIHNRLRRGMPLQLDSTIHFIQNSRGKIALALSETKINDPYNTYRFRGLPPGPIGSPTRAAVEAALSPAQGDWLYFITVAPRDTRFTSSYDQFLIWKKLYRENYRKGLFDD